MLKFLIETIWNYSIYKKDCQKAMEKPHGRILKSRMENESKTYTRALKNLYKYP